MNCALRGSVTGENFKVFADVKLAQRENFHKGFQGVQKFGSVFLQFSSSVHVVKIHSAGSPSSRAMKILLYQKSMLDSENTGCEAVCRVYLDRMNDNKNMNTEVTTKKFKRSNRMKSETMKAQSEAKHTAGPWHLIGSRGSGFSVHAMIPEFGDSDALARCNNASLDTNEANARLISQAPAMLEALEAMVDTMELFQCGANIENLPQYKRAKAIIARAKGETK